MAKSLLTVLVCPHTPCDQSKMVYKTKKLCDDHKTCKFRLKIIRQQKAQAKTVS